MTSSTLEEMKDVYLVLELMETDLHKVLKGLKKTGLLNCFGCVIFFFRPPEQGQQERDSAPHTRVSLRIKCYWPSSTSTLPTFCIAI